MVVALREVSPLRSAIGSNNGRTECLNSELPDSAASGVRVSWQEATGPQEVSLKMNGKRRLWTLSLNSGVNFFFYSVSPSERGLVFFFFFTLQHSRHLVVSAVSL